MKKVVIVGAGLAGSYLAAHLPADCAVTLVTKKTRGGIATQCLHKAELQLQLLQEILPHNMQMIL
nr:hypothetical protein [Liquorilactobacillus satsumensis]